MKTKGTTKAREIGLAQSEAEKLDKLFYGRAIETEAGALVVSLRSEAAEGLREMLKQPRPEASANGLRRLLQQVETITAKARNDFTEKSVVAIRRGDGAFFRGVAVAVDLIASANGQPVDKYRATVEMTFWTLGSQLQRPPTMQEIVTSLVRQFPELKKGREDDSLPRQVRRWCKELGITLAKANSARNGWHRGEMQMATKPFRKVNKANPERTLADDEAALLLLNAVSPKLAEEAQHYLKENQ